MNVWVVVCSCGCLDAFLRLDAEHECLSMGGHESMVVDCEKPQITADGGTVWEARTVWDEV